MIEFLFSRKRIKIKLGLDNIRHLLSVFGHPEESYASIHVAGTNGKGSTSALLEAIYMAAGYKTGLNTSPHLIDVRERIRIDGQFVPLDVFREKIEFLYSTIQKHGCSFFEILTATAFAHFRDEKVDIAIVETGLGGRLDATNVLHPKLSVITEIDIDHVKQLGATFLQIAQEKAGIIKPGVPVLSNASDRKVQELFALVCRERDAEFIDASAGMKIENPDCTPRACYFDLTTPQNHWPKMQLSLLGKHQVQNAVTAVRAVETLHDNILPVKRKAVYAGLERVKWNGRMQVLQEKPTVVVDVAHNDQGISVTIKEVDRIFLHQKLFCVFGVLKDKDFSKMLRTMNPFVDFYIAVTPNDERALPAGELREQIAKMGKRVVAGNSIIDGLKKAQRLAGPEDLICIIGSHFVAGEVINYYKNP
ncbi:MAG TPA: bifunctional folylpolyglutamate synthase/dihydrofolate synthase [Bacteroidetes bacterium]|nr:bifunctional folylpolyglutamate synthase/dihydrofolate synthase [Bacteroidota bacterium]